MRSLDLRARLIAAVGLVAVLQLLAAFAVVSLTRSHLVDQIDDRLAAAAGPDRDVALRGASPNRLAPPADGRPVPERLGDIYEGVLEGDGSLITLFAANSTGVDLPPPSLDITEAHAASEAPIDVDAVEGDLRYRVAAVSDGGSSYFITAIPLDGVDATMSRLIAIVATTAAAIAIVLALVAWWVLRLGIAPIKRMTASAEAIADGNLSERLSDTDARTEAGQLGAALNTMLTQIETSFDERTRAEDRLRQFIADASHELRTPVATVRGYAELYRAGGLDDPAQLDDAMRRTHQESERMSRLIGDMLRLAKLDQHSSLRMAPVDLALLARDAAADACVTHTDRHITSDTDGEPLVIDGDEDLLRQAIANLVDNAILHTDQNASVVVAAHRVGTDVEVLISDDGDGMPPEVAARVTERFYRADPARSRHKGGSGLGLAIVDSVVDAHGGDLDILSVLGEGTTVRLTLPLPVESPAQA